jgi:hypothetical protein
MKIDVKGAQVQTPMVGPPVDAIINMMVTKFPIAMVNTRYMLKKMEGC